MEITQSKSTFRWFRTYLEEGKVENEAPTVRGLAANKFTKHNALHA